MPKERVIFTLDNYSVPLAEKVRLALGSKGYFLIALGGGITGDVQTNDTHQRHRTEESALMISKLNADRDKVVAFA